MQQLAEESNATTTTPVPPTALPEGTCLRCGASGAKRVEFMRVMSFIAVTRHSRFESQLCPSCTALIGMKELAISCSLGWWGVPWGLMTLQAIWINGKSLLGSNQAGRLGAAAVLSLVGWGGSAVVGHFVATEQERVTAQKTGDWVDDATAEEYQRATDLVDAGHMEAALVPIRRAYESAPDSAAINALYGYIELSLGQPAKAKPFLQAAMRKDPSNFDALHMMAAAHLQCDEPAKAADCLKRWLDQVGDDRMVHEQYQDASVAAGRGEVIVASYRKRLELQPQAADAHYLLGRMLGMPDEVAPLMRRALELDPGLRSARVHLIYALIGQRELADAEAQCKLLAPAGLGEPPTEMLSAAVAFAGKDLDRALSELGKAIEAGRGESPMLFQRAQYAAAAERYDEAHSLLQAAAEGAPLDPGFQLHVTVQEITLLIEEDRFDEARTAIAAAREGLVGPDQLAELELAWLEGLLEWLEGDLAGAASTFESAPHAEQAWMSWRTPRVGRGMVLALQGDLDAARKDWELVASAPTEGEDWEQVPMAKMLLAQLDPQEFLAQVRRSTPTFDNNAHFAIGLRLELEGRFAEAKVAYQAALDTSFGRNHPYELARVALERLSAAGH